MLAMISETDRLLGKDLFSIPSPANFEFYISQHDDMDLKSYHSTSVSLEDQKQILKIMWFSLKNVLSQLSHLFLDACSKVPISDKLTQTKRLHHSAMIDSYSKPSVAPSPLDEHELE